MSEKDDYKNRVFKLNENKTIDEMLKNPLLAGVWKLELLNYAVTYGYSVKLGYCLHSNNYRKLHGLHTRRKLK